MRADLRSARDAAVALHDAAVSRHSPNFDAAFAAAMGEVVGRLERIVADAESDRGTDPAELAKTWRWLGDAWFDHGRCAGRPSWERGAEAYLKAERLLADRIAPVEQAKLDFNFGNTLRALSEGADVGLLEATEVRYERAAKAFRENRLPNFESAVSSQLGILRSQLKLAREHAIMQRDHDRMQEQLAQLPTAGKIEQAAIARDIQRTAGTVDREGLAEAVGEAVAAVADAVRSDPGIEPQLAELAARAGDLARAFAGEPKPDVAAGEPTDPMAAAAPGMADMLQSLIQQEVKAGSVTSDRAAHLARLLKSFMATLPAGGDDVVVHDQKAARMREIVERTADTAVSASWPGPPPAPESRAGRVDALLAPLYQLLLREMTRPMRPTYEAEAARELFQRVVQLRAEVRQAGDDPARVAGIDEQAWRVALDTQRYARRYHLTVARPHFAIQSELPSIRSLFVAGADDLHAAARRLAEREGMQLFLEAPRDDMAQGRWSQLLAASVGVFDLGLPDGPERAQVAYELGLALAFGKPCAVFTRTGIALPFDVEIEPIDLVGDAEDDMRRLQAGAYAALSSVTRGGLSPQLGDTGRAALDALRRHIDGAGRASDQLTVHLRVAEANVGDAVALHRTLQGIAGSLGGGGPAILLPDWQPPQALPVTAPPRCFHVMPFSRDWSNAARDGVREACNSQGWAYMRGDDSEEQRIVPAIWREISQASAVVIDITDHNPNVALELGLVHALGRPYRVVVQDRAPRWPYAVGQEGDPRRHAFPSLAKVQLHAYRIDGAAAAVGEWSASGPKTLAEIVGPFLAAARQGRPLD